MSVCIGISLTLSSSLSNFFLRLRQETLVGSLDVIVAKPPLCFGKKEGDGHKGGTIAKPNPLGKLLVTMKLKLPSSLKNNHGIDKVASDDISCCSDSSSSNRSVLSLLSSRSRSKSRARKSKSKSRSISFRDTNTPDACPTKTSTRPTKRPMSPRQKIMKRFQKSFSPLPSNGTDQSHSHHDDDFDSSYSDSGIDYEKENDIVSTNASRIPPADSDLYSIDSAIVSIANRAVAVNFPSSSYIRPVPIKREDNVDTIEARTDTGDTKPTRTVQALTSGQHDCRASREKGSVGSTNLDDGVATRSEQPANERKGGDASQQMIQKPGEVLIVTDMIGETARIDYNEADCGDGEIREQNISPTSLATATSLLSPLVDDDDELSPLVDDDEESENLSLPDFDLADIGSGSNDEPDKHPETPGSKADAPKIEVQANPIVLSTSCVQQTCVFSPLSEGSFRHSRNSSSSDEEELSVSIDKSSLVLDYCGDDDDGSSNNPVANLAKSTFIPPREVITITLGPVLAAQKTPAPYVASIDPAIGDDECKEESYARYKRKGKRKKEGKDTIKTIRKRTTPPRDNDDDEKRMAQELAVRLGKDLEAMRVETEKYASKNRRLETRLQILKAQQDEHMVHRGRLVKSCMYTAPVFLLCGGLDVFLATILLVWVLVEVDGYLEGNEGHDGDDEDEDGDDEEDGFSDGVGASDSDDLFSDGGSSMDL